MVKNTKADQATAGTPCNPAPATQPAEPKRRAKKTAAAEPTTAATPATQPATQPVAAVAPSDPAQPAEPKKRAKKTAAAEPAAATPVVAPSDPQPSNAKPAGEPKQPVELKKRTKKAAAAEPATATAPSDPAQPAESAMVKAEPKKRQPSDKKSKFELQGVGIAPSRVKSVLAHVALNPREARARDALRAAENRPVMPKQVKDGPAPVLPPQGPQKHIAELDAETVACVADAVAVHSAILREEYERETVAKLSDSERERYRVARAAAKKSEDFSPLAFHTEFSAKFYDKFEAFQAADSYSLGPNSRYNEWTRAIALINKLCVRLSHGTRDILAAYLDNVVLQLAENAVHNCVAAGKTIVKLEHAVSESEGFAARVPLAPWLRTLPSFDHAKLYVAQRASQKAATEQEPAKPDLRYTSVYADNAMFKTYVEDLCVFVQQKHKTALNLSTDFKQFCDDMVYGAILRVAEVLKQNVEYSEVKTISDGLMKHTIMCINLAAGINNTAVMADLAERLAKFEAFREPEDDEIIGV
jgi:hypothetical protein